MEVIVAQRFGRWKIGDVVEVKGGYARNYLLPRGQAIRATAENKERFSKERVLLEQKNAERHTMAQDFAAVLDGKQCVLLRQAGESGQLYGSVSARDIAQAFQKDGLGVEREQIVLSVPIRTIGLHTVRVALHPEVLVSVRVNVARTEEEAGAQERGEVLIGSAAEREEARLHAEALLAQIQENALEHDHRE